MNTAFLDAQNLAWKIHHVEAGFAKRSILASYEDERKLIAENLLEFDSKYASLFSARAPSTSAVASADKVGDGKEPGDENEFVKMFKSSCEFTSGYGVAYNPNVLNWDKRHPAKSSLFNPKGVKLKSGRIFTPANVTRVVDANVVHLEQEIPWNGSFRIYLFAGSPSLTRKAIVDFDANLKKKNSFIKTYERPDIASVTHHEIHNPHSLFYTFCIIFNAPRQSIEISEILPEVLLSYSTHVYADDIWDPRVPDAKAAAHAKVGLDEEKGGLVVVRPDGYVGCVVQLVEGDGTVDALNAYFGAFVTKDLGRDVAQAHL